MEQYNIDNINFIFDEKSQISEFINLKKIKNSINFNEIPNHLSKLMFTIITTKFFLGERGSV